MKSKYEFYFEGAGYNRFDLVHKVFSLALKETVKALEDANSIISEVGKIPLFSNTPDESKNKEFPLELSSGVSLYIEDKWSDKQIGLFLKFCYLNDYTVLTIEEAEDFILKKYNEFSWSRLGERKDIEFTQEFFDCFSHKVDWFYIQANIDLMWDVEFVCSLPEELNLYNLSSYSILPWSVEFIEKYKE